MTDHSDFEFNSGSEFVALADDGCRLSFRLFGQAGQPAVVLLHPIGFDGRFWAPLVPILAKTFMLIVPDARGHGGSECGSGETSIAQLASDVLRILDMRSLEKVGLIGCSLGSTVGMYLGAHASSRFDWLILANAPAKIPLPVEAFDQAIAGARAGALPHMARDMLGRWLADATKAVNPDLLEILLNQMLETDGHGFANAFAALRNSDRNADLSLIEPPALVVTGEADHSFPPEAAQSMGNMIRGAQTAIILNAGHLAPAEQPRQFADAIERFLQNTATRGTPVV
jgi:3-oxoadipate enol-lactonase